MSEWTSRYEYTESNVESYAPSRGGVYRLLYYSGGSYYVFYVGKSENLKRRLLEHLSYSEPDPCIKRHTGEYTCYFRYVRVDFELERDRIERQQISEYHPTCNR